MEESSSYTLLQRDGTSQAQRCSAALDPAYITIDERSIADWIRFAQSFAKQLIYFDPDNADAGTWESFLGDGAGNEKFIADLLSYINDPGSFANDPEKIRSLSRPHLALFVSFLQLLGYVKTQLNGFTRRHLDFYYNDILGLSKRKPVPDVVNVIIGLTDDVQDFLFQKGTELFAGKDNIGKDLIYKTEKDTVINRATVQLIKTLYTGKNTYTIQQVRENSKKQDKGFLEIWQLAVGDQDNGYKLPPYKDLSVDANTETLANTLYWDIENEKNSSDALLYINGHLMLLKEEFKNIIQIFKTGLHAQWTIIDSTLKKAYRRKKLKQIREKNNPGSGFLKMFEFALGEPEPGNPLPLNNGNAADLTVLYNDLVQGDAAHRNNALNYIDKELCLLENSFKYAIATRANPKAGSADWIVVYADIENAQLKKRGSQVPEPVRDLWKHPVATNDARAKAVSTSKNHQFNTFGKPGSTAAPGEQLADTGFAISSPLLVLQEGERNVTLSISFQENKLVSELPENFQPFSFFLSSSKGWLKLQDGLTVSFGNFITGNSIEAFTATLDSDNRIVTKSTGADYSVSDLGNYVVLAEDNSLYLISKIISPQSVAVMPKGKAHLLTDRKKIDGSSPRSQMEKYDAAYVRINSMRMSFMLPETAPPVVAPAAAGKFAGIQSDYPVLKILLNDPDGTGQANNYPLVKGFRLQKVEMQVKVTKLKTLTLQNDDTVINYKKPFEPFGYKPEVGSHLYFAHHELCSKQPDTINLQFEWMNAPVDFSAYYADYFKIQQYNADDKTTMKEFTCTLELVDQKTVVELKKDVKLFPAAPANSTVTDTSAKENKKWIDQVDFPAALKAKIPSVAYQDDAEEPEQEAINWKRYYQVTLHAPDFQHDLYPVLLTRQIFIKAETSDTHATLKLLPPLNPPYTPKLASFTVGYAASCEIDIDTGVAGPDNTMYHLTAFGYNKLNITGNTGNVYFLPYFENTGELYMGIADLLVPRNLSLLFKMADGSADPDLANAQVNWHYLSSNEWKELAGTSIVSDTTNGLLNTGIIELAVPADATSGDTLFSENLHWLRASVTINADAVPDTIDILAQGISAVFTDHDNADDHFLYLLAPESIHEPVVKIPEVKKITQPFSSSKGKPAEAESQFHMRVSERLRHKGRVLTMWDYERLILEQFPDIYKVKCLPAGTHGGVDVIVVPNIKGRFPFDPFEPKVPADGIINIKTFVEQRMPSWAAVTVRNASYVQVKTRFSVKIREGYSESFYIARLQEELIRYLAPWAYDDGADIFLNGRIDADMIVNFAAERPYVDYVAGIRLFRLGGGNTSDIVSPANGENFIQAESPGEILVSATSHQIDTIGEELYKNDFQGIGYMRIGLDFKIAYEEKDLQGIGYMRVELDFEVA